MPEARSAIARRLRSDRERMMSVPHRSHAEKVWRGPHQPEGGEKEDRADNPDKQIGTGPDQPALRKMFRVKSRQAHEEEQNRENYRIKGKSPAEKHEDRAKDIKLFNKLMRKERKRGRKHRGRGGKK
jgi:hypothetical protein